MNCNRCNATIYFGEAYVNTLTTNTNAPLEHYHVVCFFVKMGQQYATNVVQIASQYAASQHAAQSSIHITTPSVQGSVGSTSSPSPKSQPPIVSQWDHASTTIDGWSASFRKMIYFLANKRYGDTMSCIDVDIERAFKTEQNVQKS